MTRLTLGAAAVALLAIMPAAAPAQRLSPAVVAVVDTNRVARECTACATAQQQLQTQAQQLQQRQQQLSQPLQTEATAIRTAIGALNGKEPDAALRGRIDKLQQQQNTANTELEQKAQQLRSTEANVLQQINTALAPVINQAMQTRGASLVVDRGAVLAVSPSIDITNDVLAGLNNSLKTISVTPLPQQQQPAQGR